jgi:hypothetical protein
MNRTASARGLRRATGIRHSEEQDRPWHSVSQGRNMDQVGVGKVICCGDKQACHRRRQCIGTAQGRQPDWRLRRFGSFDRRRVRLG